MSKKMIKLGSVNPCNMMTLYDVNNNYIGECLDTPNNFAVACLINDKVEYGKAWYQYFGEVIRSRHYEDISDRINIYKKLSEKKHIDTINEINKHKEMIKFY